MSVFYDAWQCPIVTFLIMLSIARYTKLWKGLGNTIDSITTNNSTNPSSSSSGPRNDADTYTLDELENKGEFWRILNSTFNIQNPFHLWLAVVSFWGCKEIEKRIGSINFMLYATIFMFNNACLSIISVFLLRRQTFFPSHIFNISSHTALPTSGLLDLTFAFLIADALTFSKQHSESLPDTIKPTYFVVGLIETPSIVAPTVLLLICQLMLDKVQWLANVTSITTGFMLWLGPLQVIPNWYWKICLLLNVMMINVSNHLLLVNTITIDNNNDDNNDNNNNIINTNSNESNTTQHEHSFSLSNRGSNYEAVSVYNFQSDTTNSNSTSNNSGIGSGNNSNMSSYNEINGLLDRDEFV